MIQSVTYFVLFIPCLDPPISVSSDIFRIPGIGLEKYHQTADVVIGAARKRLLYLPSTRWTGNTERAWKGGWDEFNLDLD